MQDGWMNGWMRRACDQGLLNQGPRLMGKKLKEAQKIHSNVCGTICDRERDYVGRLEWVEFARMSLDRISGTKPKSTPITWDCKEMSGFSIVLIAQENTHNDLCNMSRP